MKENNQSFAYFVGALRPIGNGLYQLHKPYDGDLWHIYPHESQELCVYIEKKQGIRLAPVMPT